jgi:hypothetical protein
VTATSGAALLKKIKPTLRRKRVHICLRPDLLNEWNVANEAMQESMAKDAADAADEGRPRLATQEFKYSDATIELANKVEAIEKRINAADAVFEFEALPQDEWTSMVAGYPPRKDNPYDLLAGYDRSAALDAGVRRCLVDPVFEECPSESDGTIECDHSAGSECDGGSWQAFLRVCASSEWEELRNGVSEVNTETQDNPKSVLASRVLSSSAASSGSRKRGVSRIGSSTAGPLAK